MAVRELFDALTVVNDLTKPEQVPELVAAVVAHHGTIDILVNNAGTSWGAAAEQYPVEAWNKVMTLNATSVFQLSQAVANRCFIPRRSGNIIVVARKSLKSLYDAKSPPLRAAHQFTTKATLLDLLG